MSKIALSPDALGTGTFTIAAPNSNTNRTLTLPDATTTVVGTDTTDTLTNKSIVATQLTGTIAAARLPAGTVLQVVQATTSTPVTVASATYADTGLSASITPTSSSSKILILISQSAAATRNSSATGTGVRVLRGSTVIFTPSESVAGSAPDDIYLQATGATVVNLFTRICVNYLDSPATTSAITYKTQGAAVFTTSSGTAVFQASDTTNGTSTIVLMEIAG